MSRCNIIGCKSDGKVWITFTDEQRLIYCVKHSRNQIYYQNKDEIWHTIKSVEIA